MVVFVLGVMMMSRVGLSQTAMPQNIRATNTLDRLSDVDGLSRSDLLYGIPLPPGEVIGDTYLDKKWNIASFILSDSEKLIEGYYVKIDVKADMLEIKTKSGIKVIEGKKVKSVVWLDSVTNQPHYFASARDYKLDGVPLTGFLEVMVDGSMPLMKRTTIFEKEPDYIPAFDVGSRDTKIFKKEAFYYAKKGELAKITNKKNLLPAFADQSGDIETYIKINKLDVSKQNGLVRVFEYYNAKANSQP